MKIPYVDLKAQYSSIKEEIKKELDDSLENTAFILGNKVANFEKRFAQYCGKKHAICVNSGTSALHLALIAEGIECGDEVITVPYTFIATVESISYVGAKPVFVDIDPVTYNINISKIEDAITEKTKAIMPVHLYGQPADMDPIKDIADKHGLKIIEDCCQSHGAEYKGKRVPCSTIGCFSFYPGKNLGAYGEGGAVVTDDDGISEKVKMLRDHGQNKKYYHKYIGYNYRMTGFQGAILGVKLKYLDEWTDARRNAAKLYASLLDGVVVTPTEADYAKHVYHVYAVKAKKRDELVKYLNTEGVSTGIHYPIPVHLQQAYSFMGHGKDSFPQSESAADEIMSLPMYPEISQEQIQFVADRIRNFST